MIGLDTSILVRYFVADDPKQHARAAKVIEANCQPEFPGYVNRIVMCELVWVLKRAYKYDRQAIADVVGALLVSADVRVDAEKAVADALSKFRAGSDFADAMIGALNKDAGCVTTKTFDREAKKLLTFEAA